MFRKSLLTAGVLLAGWQGSLQAAEPEFFLRNNDRIVFLGDGITDQRLYTSYIEAYALTRFPTWNLFFRNAGEGNDTAWLRQRSSHEADSVLFAATGTAQQAMVEKLVGAGLARDVLPLKPTVVTLDFGLFDHNLQAFREDIFKAYVRSQTELVKVLKANGARVALLTPLPIEERRPDPDQDVRNQSLKRFAVGLRAVAAVQDVLFVDRFNLYLAILVRERAAKSDAFVSGCEAVHRGKAGHLLMAWMILKRMGAPALVASAEFDVVWFLPNKLVKARQCQVQNVKYAKGVLSFDRLAAALPMPIDDRAGPALKMAPILDDLNRDDLKIAGLRADRYEVVIDGEVVATVAADDLAKGWNLASVVTPDTRQADDVLRWVYNKNGFYSRWRDIRMNGGTPEQLAEPEREIAINETRINTARQLKSRHFEVRPVKQPENAPLKSETLAPRLFRFSS